MQTKLLKQMIFMPRKYPVERFSQNQQFTDLAIVFILLIITSMGRNQKA